MGNIAFVWLSALTVAAITLIIIKPRHKHDKFGLQWSSEMTMLLSFLTCLAVILAFFEWFAEIVSAIADTL